MPRRFVSTQLESGHIAPVYELEAQIMSAHAVLDEIGVPLLVGERDDLVVRLRSLRDWISERHGPYQLDETLRGTKP